jgi:pimeloyl-ACP methyl ester carboxylesterase
MNACNQYLQGLQRAADVSCPVLLVLGRGDRLTPVRGTIPLQEALPDPRVVVLEASGHTLMTEAPNALLDALRDFLQAHRALA